MTNEKEGPLSHLRVIEMGQLLAGPFCGQLLADFGAEVIKIEPPKVGDVMRNWGHVKAKDKTLWWPILARNKKSITLNARVEEGQAVIKELVSKADILLENFRPGTMEKWGLGYEELSKINPRLIMIRVSGFGQTGPYAKNAGYGSIGEAMGGLRYIVGDPSSAPSRMGISIGDTLAATFACLGALAALQYRDRTGEGQVVDSAIYEAVLNIMESLIPEYQQAGYIRERTGAILKNVAPSNVYPCNDGKMVLIAANQDTVFARLVEAMGTEELLNDERYSTHEARGVNQDELDELIANWTSTKTSDELIALMTEHGVPHGKIYTAQDMLEDAHFAAREAIVNVAHPLYGELKMQNISPKLSKTPGTIRWLGPELGQHNDEIYSSFLNMNDDVINDFVARGII